MPPDDDRPRAVIYNRVSLDRRKRGRSVEQQDQENRAVCAELGWPVVASYTDNSRSASRYATKAREEFDRLVRFLEGGGADVLVTWESSRSQRDLGTYVALRDLCMTAGVLWRYSGRTYDLTVAADRKATAQDAVAAEASSDETSERVKRHTRAAAAAGRPHGRGVYGLHRVYDPNTRELARVEEDPVAAPVVREAAARVLASESVYSVARDFAARRIPAPGGVREWHQSTIRRLLLNPTLAGLRVHLGEVVGPGTWPAIISEADAADLRRLLGDPGRRTTTRQGQIRHLLSYLAVCGRPDPDGPGGRCGAPCKVLRNRGTLSYLCSERWHVSRRIGQWHGHGPGRDAAWSDRYDGVDDWVVSATIERLSRPDVLERLAAPEDPETRTASDEVRVLRGQLDDFYATAAAGALSAAGLAKVEARLLPMIAAAQERADRRVGVPRLVLDLARGEDVAGRWPGLAMSQQRTVIDTLMTVWVLPAAGRTFDPSSVRIEWKQPGGE